MVRNGLAQIPTYGGGGDCLAVLTASNHDCLTHPHTPLQRRGVPARQPRAPAV